MKRIFDAKKKYEEIEIPSELKERVSAAIEQSTPKKRSPLFYTKILVPVAVCAAICIAVGVNGNVRDVQIEADTEISLARSMPGDAEIAKAETTPSVNEVLEDATDWYLSYDEYISAEELAGRLPLKKPIEMMFCSGAGAWDTRILLNADGTFTGRFSDDNAGEIGDGYPNGTNYYCSFVGKFDNIKKINDYTYTMKLANLERDETLPEEYIKDGIRYVMSSPYGVENGEEFVFYLPETHPSVLEEEEVRWWIYGYFEEITDALHVCGLINKNTTHGFFSEPFKDR